MQPAAQPAYFQPVAQTPASAPVPQDPALPRAGALETGVETTFVPFMRQADSCNAAVREMRPSVAMTSLCLSSSLNVNGLLVIVSGEVPDRVQAGERGDGGNMTRNSGRDLMGIVSTDPRQRVAGRARRGRRRIAPRRVAAANIARARPRSRSDDPPNSVPTTSASVQGVSGPMAVSWWTSTRYPVPRTQALTAGC